MESAADALRALTAAIAATVSAPLSSSPRELQLLNDRNTAAFEAVANGLPVCLKQRIHARGRVVAGPGHAKASLPWLQALLATNCLPIWTAQMELATKIILATAGEPQSQTPPPANSTTATAAAVPSQELRLGIICYVACTTLATGTSIAAAAARNVACGLISGRFGRPPPAGSSPAVTAAAGSVASALDQLLSSPQLLTACARLLAACRARAESNRAACASGAAVPTLLATIAAAFSSMVLSTIELVTVKWMAIGADAAPWAALVEAWRPAEGGGGSGGGGGDDATAHLKSAAARSLMEGLESSALLEEVAAAVVLLPPPSRQPPGVSSLMLQAANETAAGHLCNAADNVVCCVFQAVPRPYERTSRPPPLLQPTLSVLRGPHLQRLLRLGLERMALDAGMPPDLSATAAAATAAAAPPCWFLTVKPGSRGEIDVFKGRLELMRAAGQAWLYELEYGRSTTTRAFAAAALVADVPRRAPRAVEAFARLYGGVGSGGGGAATAEVRAELLRLCGIAAVGLRGLVLVTSHAVKRLAEEAQGRSTASNSAVLGAVAWALAAFTGLQVDVGEGGGGEGGEGIARDLEEFCQEAVPVMAAGFRGMAPSERAIATAAVARSGLLRSLDVCARVAARRGGVDSLARVLSMDQPLRAHLLPSTVEVMVLQPEAAAASRSTSSSGSSSGSGSRGNGGAEAGGWRAGVELGLFVTLAKATRLLCELGCRELEKQAGGDGGGGGGLEGAAAAKAAAMAAKVAVASFHIGSLVTEGAVLCPQVVGRELRRGELTAEAAARREELRAVLVRCAAAAMPPFVRLMDAMAAVYGSGRRSVAAPQAPLPEAAAAAAAATLDAFGEASLLLRRLGACVPAAALQQLLGRDLLLRLTAAAGRLMAAVQPWIRLMTSDPTALLMDMLERITGGAAGGGGAATLPGALRSALYWPPTALTQAATNEVLCAGVWLALRAPAGAAAAAGPAPPPAEDLRPLLALTSQLDRKYGAWLLDLAREATSADGPGEFRRRAVVLVRRIAADAESKGLNGTKAAWASGVGNAEPDADADTLAAAVAAVRLCGNPLCTRFEGPAEVGAARKACGGCRAVRYCCEGCQREHWAAGHKAECKALAAAAVAVAAPAPGPG